MAFAPELILHDYSRKHIEAFLQDPTHAIILHGDTGIGLTTIATAAGKILSPTQPIITIAPIEGKDISIDQIRTLYSATQSVEPSGKAIIIDDAHTMGIEAQNAFLKLLEEPPVNVYFVLVVHEIGKLLPTIISRSEAIHVRQVPQREMAAFVGTLTSDTGLKAQLGFLAPGLPAKAARLINTPELLQTSAEMTRDARSFLQGEYYERLLVANKYAGSRESAISFTLMIGQLLIYTLRKQSEQAQRLKQISEAIDKLHQNANVKLQMIHLSLSL